MKKKNKKQTKKREWRKNLQRVIKESTVEEIDDSIPEKEISIDPNDIVVFELPIDENHLGIGAAIGLGSMMHHLACREDEN